MSDNFVEASYIVGWEMAHKDLSTRFDVDTHATNVVIAGIARCGIGGFACACNKSRIGEGADLQSFSIGVEQAINDREMKVML